MKNHLARISLAMVLFAGAAFAQNEVVEEGRDVIQEARLEIVRSELRLTDEETAAFWPLYLRYRAETDAVQDRYAAMIEEYLRRYNNAELTDDYADELMATYFGIKRELLGLQEKYLPEFRGVLPALKTARLFQLENKINAEIDGELALVIPLVETE